MNPSQNSNFTSASTREAARAFLDTLQVPHHSQQQQHHQHQQQQQHQQQYQQDETCNCLQCRDVQTHDVIIEGISTMTDYNLICNVLQSVGRVMSIDIPKDRFGFYQGYAYCKYDTCESVTRAIRQLHGYGVAGSTWHVNVYHRQ